MQRAWNRENYLNSSSKRSKKSGGSGVYFCIPQCGAVCGSAIFGRDERNSGIEFFKFPEEKVEFSLNLQSTFQTNHSEDNLIHDVILINLVSQLTLQHHMFVSNVQI